MTEAHKEAIITHMKYIIRDTLFNSELLDIREYIDEIIEEKVGFGYVYNKEETTRSKK